MSHFSTLKMPNKLNVTQLIELSNLSNIYISQVKHGKRPPSNKLNTALTKLSYANKKKAQDFYSAPHLFLQSRREGISSNTIKDYNGTLSRTLPLLGLVSTAQKINCFFTTLLYALSGKCGYFKCLRVFYN